MKMDGSISSERKGSLQVNGHRSLTLPLRSVSYVSLNIFFICSFLKMPECVFLFLKETVK